MPALREDNNTSVAILDYIMEQIEEIEQQFTSCLNSLRKNLERHGRTATAHRNSLHPEKGPTVERSLMEFLICQTSITPEVVVAFEYTTVKEKIKPQDFSP